jgi:hypothetical protein
VSPRTIGTTLIDRGWTEVHEAYAAEHARRVVAASLEDYDAEYGGGRPGRPPGEPVLDGTRPEEQD